ncbi:MAG: hypothetical protein R6U29_10985 [Desulfosudaceae bacterium]
MNFNLLFLNETSGFICEMKLPALFATGSALFVRSDISYAVPVVTISQGIFTGFLPVILTFLRQVSF